MGTTSVSNTQVGNANGISIDLEIACKDFYRWYANAATKRPLASHCLRAITGLSLQISGQKRANASPRDAWMPLVALTEHYADGTTVFATQLRSDERAITRVLVTAEEPQRKGGTDDLIILLHLTYRIRDRDAYIRESAALFNQAENELLARCEMDAILASGRTPDPRFGPVPIIGDDASAQARRAGPAITCNTIISRGEIALIYCRFHLLDYIEHLSIPFPILNPDRTKQYYPDFSREKRYVWRVTAPIRLARFGELNAIFKTIVNYIKDPMASYLEPFDFAEKVGEGAAFATEIGEYVKARDAAALARAIVGLSAQGNRLSLLCHSASFKVVETLSWLQYAGLAGDMLTAFMTPDMNGRDDPAVEQALSSYEGKLQAARCASGRTAISLIMIQQAILDLVRADVGRAWQATRGRRVGQDVLIYGIPILLGLCFWPVTAAIAGIEGSAALWVIVFAEETISVKMTEHALEPMLEENRGITFSDLAQVNAERRLASTSFARVSAVRRLLGDMLLHQIPDDHVVVWSSGNLSPSIEIKPPTSVHLEITSLPFETRFVGE